MACQTLLAHRPDENDTNGVLDVATALVERHGAHLTGLHVLPRIDLQCFYEMPLALSREIEARRRAIAATLGERFEAATRTGGFVTNWRVVDGAETSLERVSSALGNTADLIVAGQAYDTGQRGARSELNARVLGAAGRPLLLVSERAARARAARSGRFGSLPRTDAREAVYARRHP